MLKISEMGFFFKEQSFVKGNRQVLQYSEFNFFFNMEASNILNYFKFPRLVLKLPFVLHVIVSLVFILSFTYIIRPGKVQTQKGTKNTKSLIHGVIMAYVKLKPIYLWRKVVCFVLFCFVVMRSTELGCFRFCSWCLWKALDEEGCMGLFPWRLDLWCAKVLEYWMTSSLKIKLN
jgi:hypothetical protein